MNIEIRCVQGVYLWRNSSSEVNDELYKGYRKGNSEEKINEFVAGWSSWKFQLNCIVSYNLHKIMLVEKNTDNFIFATAYDFLNSDGNNFNVSVWYNSTYRNYSSGSPMSLLRIPRSVNLVCILNLLKLDFLLVLLLCYY